MSNELHLNVLHETFNHDIGAASVARLVSPDSWNASWNADYTAFRMNTLAWWDDASYIAYQTHDGENDG